MLCKNGSADKNKNALRRTRPFGERFHRDCTHYTLVHISVNNAIRLLAALNSRDGDTSIIFLLPKKIFKTNHHLTYDPSVRRFHAGRLLSAAGGRLLRNLVLWYWNAPAFLFQMC